MYNGVHFNLSGRSGAGISELVSGGLCRENKLGSSWTLLHRHQYFKKTLLLLKQYNLIMLGVILKPFQKKSVVVRGVTCSPQLHKNL